MIKRTLEEKIREFIDFKKAIVIKGARQVGKTTLIKQILEDKENILWVDGDDPESRMLWNDVNKNNIKLFIEDYDYIVFDEAQKIVNIGLTVKMILDLKLKKQVIISGSSSLDLSSYVNEPLTGRKWTFELFPFSWREIKNELKFIGALQQLENVLTYGLYPEIFTAPNHRIKRLKELTSSYLYKDILELSKTKKPELLIKLLKALAYQVGSEVSYNELSNMLQADNETIKRYISLLEDSYVIFRLQPLSKNLRKEISTSRKIYFYDTGIRNALINNFQPIENRTDKGALWENFVLSEFVKKQAYKNETKENMFFWRSKANAEIDLILKENENYFAYEIKYSSNQKVKFPNSFLERYNPQEKSVINSKNFFEFL